MRKVLFNRANTAFYMEEQFDALKGAPVPEIENSCKFWQEVTQALLMEERCGGSVIEVHEQASVITVIGTAFPLRAQVQVYIPHYVK